MTYSYDALVECQVYYKVVHTSGKVASFMQKCKIVDLMYPCCVLSPRLGSIVYDC